MVKISATKIAVLEVEQKVDNETLLVVSTSLRQASDRLQKIGQAISDHKIDHLTSTLEKCLEAAREKLSDRSKKKSLFNDDLLRANQELVGGRRKNVCKI